MNETQSWCSEKINEVDGDKLTIEKHEKTQMANIRNKRGYYHRPDKSLKGLKNTTNNSANKLDSLEKNVLIS